MTTSMLETCRCLQRQGVGHRVAICRAAGRWAGVAALCTVAALAGGCTVVSLDSANWPPPGGAASQIERLPTTPAAARDTGSVNLNANWVGHYEGIAPCADCAGVRILLTLNQDSSYTLSLSYMESNRKPSVVRGRFTWSSDGTEITLDEKGEHRRYAVSWIELRMLNRDGSPMLGVLGEQLTLKKRLK